MGGLRGQDLNLRPSGYEPDELPGCSTPRHGRKPFGFIVSIQRKPEGFIACSLAPIFRGKGMSLFPEATKAACERPIVTRPEPLV